MVRHHHTWLRSLLPSIYLYPLFFEFGTYCSQTADRRMQRVQGRAASVKTVLMSFHHHLIHREHVLSCIVRMRLISFSFCFWCSCDPSEELECGLRVLHTTEDHASPVGLKSATLGNLTNVPILPRQLPCCQRQNGDHIKSAPKPATYMQHLEVCTKKCLAP